MIIGIDASKASSSKKTGIDNTAYQIIFNLQKIDKKNSYYLYTNTPLPSELKTNDNFVEKFIPFPRFWNRFRLPLALLKDKPDKFLELTTSIPPYAPKKTAVILHDFAFKIFPEAYSNYELLLQESAVALALQKAKRVIVTSEASKADLLNFYECKKTSISVVPLGYNEDVFKKIYSPKDILNLKKPYFLSIGRIEKRKNTANLIESFLRFKEKYRTDHKLVLVGKQGFGYQQAEKKIDSAGKNKSDIILAGYVEDKDLPHLYSKSEALVYPSLYEGFGLPILEGWASETPVIASNISTLSETANGAALLVDPLDPDEIAESLHKISTDPNLRKKLITSGKTELKKYSWEKTAIKIHQILEEI